MKKILIFGSNGFVGKYLAFEFKQNGYEVYGSDISKENLNGYSSVYYQCDITDEKQTKKVISEIYPDKIVNLAAISSVSRSWKETQNTVNLNVIGALNILESVKDLGIGASILLIGSSEEYARSNMPISENFPLNAGNPYGISKIAQERFAEIYRSKYGMKIYCVRAFNHTGMGQSESFVIPSWCKQAAMIYKSGNAGTINVGNINIKRDFSDVRDVVRAYRMVIESDDCNKIYNVGSGRANLLKDILDHIILLANQNIAVNIDDNLFRKSENEYICCDNSLIYSCLNWKPRYNIMQTIDEMYKFYLKGSDL